MASISAAEDAGELWLATLQRALGLAAHDVKDALNGVSVNLEVIRSRAARPGVPASTMSQFADAAAQQLERLTTLLDAVLALGRAEREPTDVGAVLRRVATLCSASAGAAGAVVEVRDSSGEAALTRVRGDAVRLALAAPLLDVVLGAERSTAAAPIVCTLTADGEDLVVSIQRASRRVTMPENVAEAVRAAGIRWSEAEGARREGGEDFSLAFPRA